MPLPAKKNIVFVHGSGASTLSYNFLEIWLPEHNVLYIEYDSQETPSEIVVRIQRQIYEEFGNDPFSVVAHSYGCLLAMKAVITFENCKEFVAMSAPWGGSRTAKWLSYAFRNSKLFNALNPKSVFITALQSVNNKFKIINVVTTGNKGAGNDLAGMGETNDGTLTVRTQKSVPSNFKNLTQIEMGTSHNEVLVNFETVEIIKSEIFYD
jgi:pimeloyl-ACP methyl ester carboxylesterase|tara:strand:+ start:962 stop:1588 length:627 start_codon:yes stop_codon:yes gene_type:complete